MRRPEPKHRRAGDRLGPVTANGRADPYIDKGISASRYATQARGDFERLMADLWAGLLDGVVLGLWESSRGSRQVGEWVAMLDEMERRGVHVWASTQGRCMTRRTDATAGRCLRTR